MSQASRSDDGPWGLGGTASSTDDPWGLGGAAGSTDDPWGLGGTAGSTNDPRGLVAVQQAVKTVGAMWVTPHSPSSSARRVP